MSRMLTGLSVRLLPLLLPLLVSAAALAQPSAIETSDTTPRALSLPMAGLDPALREQFTQGRSLFAQMWVIAPSRDSTIDGLGPLYNRLSCASCHPGNGRGRAPDAPGEEMRSMLVRLSIAGASSVGGPNPHPRYGDQLNESAVPGVQPEGRAEIRYRPLPLTLGDGEQVVLRQPLLSLVEPGYGSFDGILTSARIGPALTGMGLLDALSDGEILAFADPADRDGDGISGRPNWAWDQQRGSLRLGRFGAKANVPTLRQQIAGAFAGDLGITSTLFMQDNCMPQQSGCAAIPSGGEPELSSEQLDALTRYHQLLAVPARRRLQDPQVQYGEQLFTLAGCGGCHRPTLRTAAEARPALLAGQTIHPYSDLLLHDMGWPLSDGRPDFAANGREWRTAPLWGLGLAQTVADKVGYLHDGRARTPLEAILWHAGEAQGSREAVIAMDRQEREALLAFLNSL